MWPERTHATSVSKTEELTHSSGERRQLRRDCQCNCKKDTKDDASEEEEIPLKEEENLNKSSDEEMYSWDERGTHRKIKRMFQ